MKTQKLTKSQKRMKAVVAAFQKYVSTYDQQGFYESYSDETFINDILYGVGIALNPGEFSFANGFDKFKLHLKKHLEK